MVYVVCENWKYLLAYNSFVTAENDSRSKLWYCDNRNKIHTIDTIFGNSKIYELQKKSSYRLSEQTLKMSQNIYTSAQISQFALVFNYLRLCSVG